MFRKLLLYYTRQWHQKRKLQGGARRWYTYIPFWIFKCNGNKILAINIKSLISEPRMLDLA